MSVSLDSSSLSSFRSQYKYSLGASENLVELRTFQAHMQEYVMAIALMLGQPSRAQVYFKPEGLGPQFPIGGYVADQLTEHHCMLRLQITALNRLLTRSAHISHLFWFACVCRVVRAWGPGPQADKSPCGHHRFYDPISLFIHSPQLALCLLFGGVHCGY